MFVKPITNITVPIGREAILECVVQNLNAYKVGTLAKSFFIAYIGFPFSKFPFSKWSAARIKCILKINGFW